jgi:hypothetical protein
MPRLHPRPKFPNSGEWNSTEPHARKKIPLRLVTAKVKQSDQKAKKAAQGQVGTGFVQVHGSTGFFLANMNELPYRSR